MNLHATVILLARTLALWNYHVYVKILIAGGLIELVVSFSFVIPQPAVGRFGPSYPNLRSLSWYMLSTKP